MTSNPLSSRRGAARRLSRRSSCACVVCRVDIDCTATFLPSFAQATAEGHASERAACQALRARPSAGGGPAWVAAALLLACPARGPPCLCLLATWALPSVLPTSRCIALSLAVKACSATQMAQLRAQERSKPASALAPLPAHAQ